MPGPTLVVHFGTCQGLASQGPEGAPAGDFKSPNAFQKGTKTFCRTKASTGEQPSPFLFKSLSFPAGWPGHSRLFFPIINGPSCNTQGGKPSPRPGQGPTAATAPGRPPAADKGSSLRHPLGEALEPPPRAKATAGVRGGFRKFLPAFQTFSCPWERAAIRPSQGLLESLFVKGRK